jgi:two-component system response regulator DevR
MVAEKHPRLVPASYLDGASCLLPAYAELRRGKPRVEPGLRTGLSPFAQNLPGGQVPPRELLFRLTPAERLVVIHVAQGLSNKEISSALNRAEPTVKHQVSSAMRKLGVQSRCQLIVRLLT